MMDNSDMKNGASLTNGDGLLSGQDVGMTPLGEPGSTAGVTKSDPAAPNSTEPALTVGATENVPTTTGSNINIPLSAFESNAPDNTGKEQASGQFQPGQSGNPAGRPKGSRNKATLAVQALLEGEAEAISRKAVELAKIGELSAIKLVLERVLPPRKDAPVLLDIPRLEKAEDAAKAVATILEAVGKGEITPAEGQAISALVESYRKVLETQELEQRISKLEEMRHGKP